MISCPEKDTYDGKNLLQGWVNLSSFYQDAAEDARISYHRHINN